MKDAFVIKEFYHTLGSPVNVENKENRTPLHQAVIGRNMETVTALLKVGAAVNIQV